MNCAHKDCKRTDASPVEFTHYSRHGELLDERTYYFCREHRKALHALKTTPTLPPAEWFAPGYMPEVRYPPRDGKDLRTHPGWSAALRWPLRPHRDHTSTRFDSLYDRGDMPVCREFA